MPRAGQEAGVACGIQPQNGLWRPFVRTQALARRRHCKVSARPESDHKDFGRSPAAPVYSRWNAALCRQHRNPDTCCPGLLVLLANGLATRHPPAPHLVNQVQVHHRAQLRQGRLLAFYPLGHRLQLRVSGQPVRSSKVRWQVQRGAC